MLIAAYAALACLCDALRADYFRAATQGYATHTMLPLTLAALILTCCFIAVPRRQMLCRISSVAMPFAIFLPLMLYAAAYYAAADTIIAARQLPR